MSGKASQCLVVWFRRDLRLQDHGALTQACRRGPVLPLFVLDDALIHHPETAVARVAFLLANLRALDQELRRLGARLLVRRGDPTRVLLELVRGSGAAGVIAHSDSERLVGRVRDARVQRQLLAAGIPLRWVEPAGSSGELLAYSAWSRQWHGAMAAPVLPWPSRLEVPPASDGVLADLPLPSLEQLGLRSDGKPLPAAGSAAGLERLEQFCEGAASRSYYWELSYPSARVTTGLSPYLKFGVVTPRQCLQRLALLRPGDRSSPRSRSALQLASRVRWGCAMHQRFRYLPQLELQSLWRVFDDDEAPLSAEQEELYSAWQDGRTGFPIVDAAARCLAAEGGWLELNFRSRAIYASFLANLCGIDWRYGALHFMRHLIDGDCPIDHYQWAMQAGVTYHGARAWTRIYHPGQVAVNRCDPHGLFIRRWLPELADLTNDQLGAPPAMAAYPRPILDYESARRRRIELLNAQRLRIGELRQAMARLPQRLLPFGSERFERLELHWASEPMPALEPAAVPLDQLDAAGWSALMSWFSMSSRATGTARREPAASSPPRRRRRQEAPGQLSLDLD